jgi:hypothetical protein
MTRVPGSWPNIPITQNPSMSDIALVVFEEIPPRRASRSQRFYMFNFAVYFALCLVGSAIAWFCWSGNPLSVIRKIDSGSFVLCSLISSLREEDTQGRSSLV